MSFECDGLQPDMTSILPYKVLDTGKPAVLPNSSWNNCEFSSFEAAVAYAKAWLGPMFDTLPEDWDGSPHIYHHDYRDSKRYVEISVDLGYRRM